MAPKGAQIFVVMVYLVVVDRVGNDDGTKTRVVTQGEALVVPR